MGQCGLRSEDSGAHNDAACRPSESLDQTPASIARQGHKNPLIERVYYISFAIMNQVLFAAKNANIVRSLRAARRSGGMERKRLSPPQIEGAELRRHKRLN